MQPIGTPGKLFTSGSASIFQFAGGWCGGNHDLTSYSEWCCRCHNRRHDGGRPVMLPVLRLHSVNAVIRPVGTSSKSIMIITTTHIASVTMCPRPTPTITPTITPTTTIITTTHIASVTMYPRPIPTITIRRSPRSLVLSS